MIYPILSYCVYIMYWLVVSTPLKIKGPDNPTSQLLPKMSFNGLSGDREGRQDKGGGERLHVKICEKIVCMDVCMYVL